MDILWCAVVVVKQYYVVGLILEVIFLEIAYVLVFVTLYTIIHRLLDHLTDSGRPYKALIAFNWAVVAIVTIITIADLGLWTAEVVKQVDSDLTWALVQDQHKLTTARDIIYFIAALEVLACTIFIAVKGNGRFHSKVRMLLNRITILKHLLHETNKLQTPIHSLIVGALSWFGYSIMFAIIEIRYYLDQSPYEYLYGYSIPDYLSFVISLFQFFFAIGVFTGILLCIMYWHKVEEVKDFQMPVSAVQHPYATGPVHYPPHVQQQQQYQQQPYQQQPYQAQQYQP